MTGAKDTLLSPSLKGFKNLGTLWVCPKNNFGEIQLFRSNDEICLSVCTRMMIMIKTIRVVVMMMILMTTMVMIRVGRGDCGGGGRGDCGGGGRVVVLLKVGVVVVIG